MSQLGEGTQIKTQNYARKGSLLLRSTLNIPVVAQVIDVALGPLVLVSFVLTFGFIKYFQAFVSEENR